MFDPQKINLHKPMKLITTTLVLLSFIFSASAQNSQAKFFTDDGQRFSVFLNGENQNPGLSSSVNAKLSATSYRVKVVFENDSIQTIEKTVPFKPNTNHTFHLKRKPETVISKGAKVFVADIKKASADTTKPKDKTGKHTITYQLNLISETSNAPVSSFSSSPAQTNNNDGIQTEGNVNTTQQSTVIISDPQPVYSTTTRVNTNTVNSGQVQQESGSVNISLNVGTPQVQTYQETTTTTTTISSEPVQTQQHVYVMPGYNGPIGCPWPMSDSDFQSARNSVEKQSFSDNQLQVAKQIVNSNCLTSAQVRELMNIFSFEDTRLDLAKYCYGYTYDLGNYYKVNDAFTFSSSVDELNQYIQSR